MASDDDVDVAALRQAFTDFDSYRISTHEGLIHRLKAAYPAADRDRRFADAVRQACDVAANDVKSGGVLALAQVYAFVEILNAHAAIYGTPCTMGTGTETRDA